MLPLHAARITTDSLRCREEYQQVAIRAGMATTFHRTGPRSWAVTYKRWGQRGYRPRLTTSVPKDSVRHYEPEAKLCELSEPVPVWCVSGGHAASTSSSSVACCSSAANGDVLVASIPTVVSNSGDREREDRGARKVIKFSFDFRNDTSTSIATEMCRALKLAHGDRVSGLIAHTIESKVEPYRKAYYDQMRGEPTPVLPLSHQSAGGAGHHALPHSSSMQPLQHQRHSMPPDHHIIVPQHGMSHSTSHGHLHHHSSSTSAISPGSHGGGHYPPNGMVPVSSGVSKRSTGPLRPRRDARCSAQPAAVLRRAATPRSAWSGPLARSAAPHSAQPPTQSAVPASPGSCAHPRAVARSPHVQA